VIAAVGIGFVGDEIMTQAELPTQEFFQLAQNIWVAVFSASLEAAVDTVLNPSNLLSSSIQITGSWEGIVVLRCPAGLARELAGMIFGPEEIADAEIFDALGELTNLLAGALQPLLPAPSEMTAPSIIESEDYARMFPSCSLVHEVHCSFRSQPIDILVFEANHTAWIKPHAAP
jgi:CheY-specific phosphatase CheX